MAANVGEGDSITPRIGNDLDELRELRRNVAAFFEGRKTRKEAGETIDLALEEIITNIIKYGYVDKQRHEIVVGLNLKPGGVVLVIEDDGRPFDPLTAPRPVTEAPIEERPIGGLGIHLIRKTADAISYERCKGKNRLEVCIASDFN